MRQSVRWLICGLVLAGLLAVGGAKLIVGEMADAEAFCCGAPPPSCGEFGMPRCE